MSELFSRATELASFLVNYGTHRFHDSTARRIRLINTAVLIADVVLFVSALITSAVLVSNGQPFVTLGNISIAALIVGFAIAPLLHRFGELAAPLYLIVFLFAVLLVTLSRMGTAQGQHMAFLLIGALAPLMFGPRRRWLAVGLVALSFLSYVVADIGFPLIGPAIEGRSRSIILAFRYVSVGGIIAVLFLIVDHALRVAESAEAALAREYARSETLLKDMMPVPIAERLKNDPKTVIADALDDVTILFVDIVDFTSRSSRFSPEELVSFLNRVFSEFDRLTEKFSLEKVKTIGDSYMVAGGVPERRTGNVFAVAEMALEILATVRRIGAELGESIEVRVGMHTGPAVAGVIGTHKLSYDVWGDTVNTAARMESQGQPGRIQVTEATRKALEGRFDFERRGYVDIKSKGEMETFYLLSKRAP